MVEWYNFLLVTVKIKVGLYFHGCGFESYFQQKLKKYYRNFSLPLYGNHAPSVVPAVYFAILIKLLSVLLKVLPVF